MSENKKPERPIPGINVRELYEERNWTALAGLGLIAVGLLFVVQDVLGIHFDLWALALIGIGGWLMVDGWQDYTERGKKWTDRSRARMTGGVVIALIGLLAAFDLNGWGLLLMGIGGALALEAWRKYEANSRVWTDSTRKRMIAGVFLAVLGFFALFNMWSTWPLILIAIGVVMLYGHASDKQS